MKRPRLVPGVALLLTFSAGVAGGEEPPGAAGAVASPLVDSRLRITAPSVSTKPVVGTLAEVSESEVVLSLPDSARRTIPRSKITQVERSEGRKRNAGKGLLIGAGVGLVTLVVSASDSTGGSSEAVAYGLIFTGATALTGAGIGALIRTEHWTSVPSSDLRLTLRPTKGRGIAAALTWRW